MLNVRSHRSGLVIAVAVQPRAFRDQVAGLKGDRLRIRLTAPPVDGAANKACRQLLAKVLALPKSRLEILSGEHARDKRILIHLDAQDTAAEARIRAKLQALAGS